MNTVPVMVVLGTLAALALTVLAHIFVLPAKKAAKLSGLFKRIHDIFTFKELFLEKIFRAIYIFATIACITVGACLFLGIEVYSGYYSYSMWYGGYGILLMIFGPITLRIVFEGIMMFILLVKNTMDINNKLKAPEEVACEEVVACEECAEIE